MVTIDHVTQCQVDPSNVGNELTTLRYLYTGLHHLYENVVAEEKPLRERDEKHGLWTMAYGNIPGLRREAVLLLPCFFHWYGVSLINYARLVGFLSGLSSNTFTRRHLEDEKSFPAIAQYCDSYVDSVGELSGIKIWRNKIAGHLAITAPRKTDNPAFLDFTVMPPVAYEKDRFRVGVMTFRRTDSTGNTHTGQLPRWSLTETHEALQARYWN